MARLSMYRVTLERADSADQTMPLHSVMLELAALSEDDAEFWAESAITWILGLGQMDIGEVTEI